MITSAFEHKASKKSVLGELKWMIEACKQDIAKWEKIRETVNSIPAKSLSTEMWGFIENGFQSREDD